MQAYITYITKDNFFLAFYTVFETAITENNIREGFRSAGLLLFDPKSIIAILDLKLKTPTPPNSHPNTA